MKHEFKYSKWSKFFASFFILILSAIFFTGIVGVLMSSKVWLAILLFAFLVFFLGLLVGVFRLKITLTEDAIIKRSIFKTKEIKFDEIKGYREKDKQLIFYHKDIEDQEVKISKDIAKYKDLLAWADDNFIDLDEKEYANAYEELLTNENYGRDEDEVLSLLSRWKIVTRALNISGVLVALSFLFYPFAYEIQLALTAMIPLLCLFVFIVSKGVVRLDSENNIPNPSVWFGLYAPAFSLIFKAFAYKTEYQFSDFIFPIAVVFSILAFFVILGGRVADNHGGKAIKNMCLKSFIPVVLYSIGLTFLVNFNYHKVTPTKQIAFVIDKEMHNGKSNSYYLYLKGNGMELPHQRYEVKKVKYNTSKLGDQVSVLNCIGVFGVHHSTVE